MDECTKKVGNGRTKTIPILIKTKRVFGSVARRGENVSVCLWLKLFPDFSTFKRREKELKLDFMWNLIWVYGSLMMENVIRATDAKSEEIPPHRMQFT